MARYDPSVGKKSPESIVSVFGTEREDNHTVYIIRVTLEKYSWTLRHRYNHFDELNAQLVQYWNLDNSLLPPKKYFGNQTEAFVQKRKNDLEVYLETVIRLNATRLPPPLSAFLEFPTYEIHGILKFLAKELFLQGDAILAAGDFFHFSPLHLHALGERLKLPEPSCDSTDKSQDVSHVLDFMSRLEHATIVGSPLPIGTSNIVPNQLTFELSRFKGLRTLKLQLCNTKMMIQVDTIRTTLETLEVHNSVSALKEVLLCDVIHSDAIDACATYRWPSVRAANFSYNKITSIDRSIRLIRNVERLDLSHNHLREMRHLEGLPSLAHLDLSFNRFYRLEALHTCLGNVATLVLTDNAIESLAGLARLFSLVTLDLTSNRVTSVDEVKHLAALPCLQSLTLTANPVTIAIDYRTRVLEIFDSRASEICLDNECATAMELDTVAVRVALRRARQGTPVEEISLVTRVNIRTESQPSTSDSAALHEVDAIEAAEHG